MAIIAENSQDKMLKILLVSSLDNLIALADSLMEEGSVNLLAVSTIKEAEVLLNGQAIDMALIDEEMTDGSGLSFVQQIARKHPFVNTGLVSSLDPKVFHDVTEGLGVFFQIPPQPKRETAAEILHTYRAIAALFTQVGA